MKVIENIEEIDEMTRNSKLDPSSEGRFHPRSAADDLRLTSGEKCGHNGFGQFLGIRNTSAPRAIQAYYEIRSNINGPWQGNRRIGPGQAAWIVCSYPAPNQHMSLHVTGATYKA